MGGGLSHWRRRRRTRRMRRRSLVHQTTTPRLARRSLARTERTQGFAADPVYGRAKCLPMLGSLKT